MPQVNIRVSRGFLLCKYDFVYSVRKQRGFVPWANIRVSRGFLLHVHGFVYSVCKQQSVA